jgi:hypothetical protein
MDEEKNFEGKRIYIVLKNKRIYTGKVIEENTEGISILDKFGKRVYIDKSAISYMEEENDLG